MKKKKTKKQMFGLIYTFAIHLENEKGKKLAATAFCLIPLDSLKQPNRCI